MPIDASIYSQLKPAKLATLGEIVEARAQREDREFIRQDRQRKLEAQQRELAEQQEVESAFRDLTGPDGPDQKAILARLYKTAPSAAANVEKHFTEMRKNASADKKAQLEAETARAQAVTRHLQGVTAASYPAAIARIQRFDPDAAAELGPTFDPVKIESITNAGLAWSEYNAKYKAALEKDDKDTAKVLNVLSLASDPEQWSDAWDMGKVLGVSNELRQMGLSEQFAPDAPVRAGELTRTPQQRAAEASGAGGGSDYARFESDYLEAEAAKLGKTVAQLSPPERVRLKTAARKVFGQADDRPSGGSAGMTPYAESNVLNRLSTQWQTASKPAVELNRQVKLMDAGLAAARRGDMAQGAQAILVTFQKILDPTSVVRESEYMRSAAGQSLDNRVRGYMEQLAKGGAGVPLSELEKFARLAKEAAKAQATGYIDSIKARIGRSADHFNIPRDLVFEDFNLESGAPTGEGTAAPPSGRFNPATGKVEPVK